MDQPVHPPDLSQPTSVLASTYQSIHARSKPPAQATDTCSLAQGRVQHRRRPRASALLCIQAPAPRAALAPAALAFPATDASAKLVDARTLLRPSCRSSRRRSLALSPAPLFPFSPVLPSLSFLLVFLSLSLTSRSQLSLSLSRAGTSMDAGAPRLPAVQEGRRPSKLAHRPWIFALKPPPARSRTPAALQIRAASTVLACTAASRAPVLELCHASRSRPLTAHARLRPHARAPAGPIRPAIQIYRPISSAAQPSTESGLWAICSQ